MFDVLCVCVCVGILLIEPIYIFALEKRFQFIKIALCRGKDRGADKIN